MKVIVTDDKSLIIPIELKPNKSNKFINMFLTFNKLFINYLFEMDIIKK